MRSPCHLQSYIFLVNYSLAVALAGETVLVTVHALVMRPFEVVSLGLFAILEGAAIYLFG